MPSSNKPLKPDNIDGEEDKSYMKVYSLVIELVIMNLILIVGGYYLDEYLSTSPILILVSTFLAMGGTIWLLLKFLK